MEEENSRQKRQIKGEGIKKREIIKREGRKKRKIDGEIQKKRKIEGDGRRKREIGPQKKEELRKATRRHQPPPRVLDRMKKVLEMREKLAETEGTEEEKGGQTTAHEEDTKRRRRSAMKRRRWLRGHTPLRQFVRG